MSFTADWFSSNVPTIRSIVLPILPASPRWLEIGCFEGRSACWVLENVPGVSLVCVDPWIEHGGVIGDVSKAMFDAVTAGRAEVHRQRSFEFLRQADGRVFDVVYIDGDHEAKSVIEDFVLAWPLVAVGGVVIFDDYEWTDTPLLPPRPAIDALLHIYGSRIEVLYKGWQVIVKKERE